jgi:hypothetical protein
MVDYIDLWDPRFLALQEGEVLLIPLKVVTPPPSKPALVVISGGRDAKPQEGES